MTPRRLLSALQLSGLSLGILTAFACKKDEVAWDAFNGEDDIATLQVTASGDPGEAVTIDLHSTTGAALIGDVRIDPGSGPVGTDHLVSLALFPEHEDRVTRVDVEITPLPPSERFPITLSMEQDSAEKWQWILPITSYGVEGEVRTDELRFVLYELVEIPATSDKGGGLFGL